MMNTGSPNSEESGFFAKLTQNIQTFSHVLFPKPPENRACAATLKSSQAFKSNISSCDLGLNIEQVQVDEICGYARVVLNNETSEEEEYFDIAMEDNLDTDLCKFYF